MHLWWNLLEPGGFVVADDYDPMGAVWPEVKQAVDDFLKVTPHEGFQSHLSKCLFVKPREPSPDG